MRAAGGSRGGTTRATGPPLRRQGQSAGPGLRILATPARVDPVTPCPGAARGRVTVRGRETEAGGRRGIAPVRPGRRRPLAAVVGMLLAAAGSGCAASPGTTAVTSHPATASPAPAGTPAVGVTATPTAAVSPAPAPTPWSLVSSPNPPGDARQAALEGVSCLSATDCWAVGWWSSDPLSGSSEPLIAHEFGRRLDAGHEPQPQPGERAEQRRLHERQRLLGRRRQHRR